MTRGENGNSGAVTAATEAMSILDDMLRLYERARAMGDEAGRCDDGAAVLEVLRRRQGVVDGLRSLDVALGVIRERLGTDGGLPGERTAVERKLAAVASAARALNEFDESLRSSLDRRRDALASELATVGRGAGVNAAYAPTASGARLSDTEV